MTTITVENGEMTIEKPCGCYLVYTMGCWFGTACDEHKHLIDDWDDSLVES